MTTRLKRARRLRKAIVAAAYRPHTHNGPVPSRPPMAHAEESPPRMRGPLNQHANALAYEWRQLTRAATFVALLTAPAFFLILYDSDHWSVVAALIVTVLAVLLFRGLVEVLARRLIPSPSLFGSEDLKADDIVARRRYWYWRSKFRRLPIYVIIVFAAAGPGPGVLCVRRGQRGVLPPVRRPAADIPGRHAPAARTRVRPAAAAVLRELRDLLRPVPVLRGPPDPWLRARRRELGREDRRRPRPGRGQGGDHAGDHAVAVGRGVRESGRQA